MTLQARLARADDLPSLLALFARSEVSASAPLPDATRIWAELIANDRVMTFVVAEGGSVLATCTLITAPNLLRGGRAHAFLENVVVDPGWRVRGLGTLVVSAALDAAWAADCQHVLLQSGRADGRVHDFYRKLGFKPGLRTAYVAVRADA